VTDTAADIALPNHEDARIHEL